MASEALFSRLAADYSRHRPLPPPELFAYLASVAPGTRLAWDCGTGNGQAALGLAEHFHRVVATDASAEQIACAFSPERVEYRVECAETTSLEAGSVDLCAVSVAVHWFDLDRFYSEVRRVLRPGGVLAVWTYHLPEISGAIDAVLLRYQSVILDGYWPAGIHYLNDRYRNLPFPFAELQPPPFVLRAQWTLHQLAGFLGSWSATPTYMERQGTHPLSVIWPQLNKAWGPVDAEREIRWPLHMRIGRLTAPFASSPEQSA